MTCRILTSSCRSPFSRLTRVGLGPRHGTSTVLKYSSHYVYDKFALP
jgi:hypothetical protein